MDQRLLVVRMELEHLDLSQIPSREFLMLEIVQDGALTTMTYQEIQEIQDVPRGLIHTTNLDMNFAISKIASWRTSQGQHNMVVKVGLLTFFLLIPEKVLLTSCSDCKRPLGLFNLHYQWRGTFRGDEDGREGEWCPLCKMMAEDWPRQVMDDRETADRMREIRSRGHQGWGTKVELIRRQAVKDLNEQLARRRTTSNVTWWRTQQMENSELYQTYMERRG